jgi:3-hydroxyacyl-[acyl-carrier-protein] dehydratase
VSSAADLGGLQRARSAGEFAEHQPALLAGIDKARFRRPVVPGDVLLVEVEVTKMRGPMGWIKGTASVEGKVVCEAEIVFALATQDREAAE